MMEPAPGDNPFVGPRALGRSDALYGRTAEVSRLRDRLVSDRIVLLYSPSGAGKTSLIEAGLRPELEELEFLVPPTIRLGGSSHVGEGGTRYQRAVLASIDGDLERSAADATLEARVEALEAGGDRELCLIFDQFEELFTLDPADHLGRDAFLKTLGAVLRNRRRWALFAIREDFIAQLDPYLEHFPTLLTSRMRLDLLTPASAEEAARGPAAESGRPFSDRALTLLIDDLRRVKRFGHDEPVPGPFIEPVQLQVVCRRVWNAAARADEATIEPARIDESGGVDAALRNFYAEQVRAVAELGVGEALIRSWIDRELIDQQGFRRPTMSPPATGGRALQVVEQLEDAHLLRGEDRQGNRWYELAHDRLVAPIREDNAAWTDDHQDDPIVRANLWAQRRAPDLLLSGSALRQAADWHEAHPAERRTIDSEFLNASRRRRWFRRGVAAVIGLIIVLAASSVIAAASASREAAQAERESQRALAGAVALRAGSFSEINPGLDLALAAESVMLVTPPTTDALGALLDARVTFGSRRWQPVGSSIVGHNGSILAITSSPDGDRLATASLDGSIRFWDAVTRRQVGEAILLDGGGLTAMDWSSDGSRIAVGDVMGLVRLVDARTGEIEAVIDDHVGRIGEVVFDPDGDLLATAGWDGTVRLWDGKTGAAAAQMIEAHEGGVASVAFSPDGTVLASAGGDSTARLWDPLTGELIAELSGGHEDKLSGVAWSPVGSTLATISDDKTARLWDVEDGSVVMGEPLVGHFSGLTSAAFSPDGRSLATSSWDGSIWLWDVETSAWAGIRIVGSNAGIADLLWLPGTMLLASVGDDQTIRLWEVAPGVAVHRSLNHTAGVTSVAFSPDGSLLVTAGEDGTARLWRTATGGAVERPLAGHDGQVLDVAFSPDGSLVATAGDDGSARLWSVATGEQVGDPLLDHQGPVLGLAFQPVSGLLATAGQDGWVVVSNPYQPAEAERRFLADDSGVSAIAFSPDAKWLITASIDGSMQLWDPNTWEPVEPLDGHNGRVSAVDFNADGTRLATTSWDGTIRFWDVSARKEIGGIPGNRGLLTSVAWSPDSTMIATGGEDGIGRIWDAATQQPVSRRGLEGHTYFVRAVDWSPDGTLATGSLDGTAGLWDVFSVETACRLVEPYVQPEQLQIYLAGHSPQACGPAP